MKEKDVETEKEHSKETEDLPHQIGLRIVLWIVYVLKNDAFIFIQENQLIRNEANYSLRFCLPGGRIRL